MNVLRSLHVAGGRRAEWLVMLPSGTIIYRFPVKRRGVTSVIFAPGTPFWRHLTRLYYEPLPRRRRIIDSLMEIAGKYGGCVVLSGDGSIRFTLRNGTRSLYERLRAEQGKIRARLFSGERCLN